MPKFDFKEQLKVGSRGEELFLERYHRSIEIFPKHDFDFVSKCGKFNIELKTDTYNMSKTPNFFMERWSDVHKKKPGGVWQSYLKGVNTFCYYFVRHNLYYEFTDLEALLERLNYLTEHKGMVYIKNKGWVTGGHLVPREELEDLYDIYEWE